MSVNLAARRAALDLQSELLERDWIVDVDMTNQELKTPTLDASSKLTHAAKLTITYEGPAAVGKYVFTVCVDNDGKVWGLGKDNWGQTFSGSDAQAFGKGACWNVQRVVDSFMLHIPGMIQVRIAQQKLLSGLRGKRA